MPEQCREGVSWMRTGVPLYLWGHVLGPKGVPETGKYRPCYVAVLHTQLLTTGSTLALLAGGSDAPASLLLHFGAVIP